ncbi:unnamed protein product, partial [Musa acuminata var. zebrina]
STSVTETVNGSHHFRISGYSLLKGMGVGKYTVSDTFTVRGYDWAIYFYPDGKSSEDGAAYVSLFIALASEGADVRALFDDYCGYALCFRGWMSSKCKLLLQRTALETSDYLKDDCLLVTCSVGVVRSYTEGPNICTIAVPPSDIAQHFGQLLKSEKGTDISFEVDGEVFNAHKLVLAARSPVFRAQLFGPMKDVNMHCIKVEDMEPSVFKALLHFIYWDSVCDMERITGWDAKCASTLMAQHLLAATDRYALDRLEVLCEVKLCEDVAINTVATILALAEQHHCFHLKSVCLKFVALPQNLRGTLRFKYLKVSCPSLLKELLQYVAGKGENSAVLSADTNDALDGSDANGRRVKPQI